MASETDICNMALGLIGDKRIEKYGDDDLPRGKYCKLFYPQARDEVLVSSGVEWRCAWSRKGPLAAVTDQPTFGWDYAYQVPTNPVCLRILGLVDGEDSNDELLEVEWKREGDYILTNEDECYVLYVSQMEDSGKFPPLLVQAIQYNLAAKLSIPISGGDRQLHRDLLEEYERLVLPDAISANNAEGYVKDEKGEASWIEAGR